MSLSRKVRKVLRRKVKDGYITIHRGYFNSFSGNVRQALTRLRAKGGRIEERLQKRHDDLYVIYATNPSGEIVGWVNWRYKGRDSGGKFVSASRYTYVSRNQRRRGIGSALVREAIRYLAPNHNQVPKFDRKAAGNFLYKNAPDFFARLINAATSRNFVLTSEEVL